MERFQQGVPGELQVEPAAQLGGRVYEDFVEGERYKSVSRTILESELRTYIGIIGYAAPDHLSRAHVEDHPIWDDISVNGTLLLGVIDGFEAETIAKYMSFSASYGYDTIRFLNPVYPGDSVYAIMEVADKYEKNDEWGIITIHNELYNQDDELVCVTDHKIMVSTAAHPLNEE